MTFITSASHSLLLIPFWIKFEIDAIFCPLQHHSSPPIATDRKGIEGWICTLLCWYDGNEVFFFFLVLFFKWNRHLQFIVGQKLRWPWLNEFRKGKDMQQTETTRHLKTEREAKQHRGRYKTRSRPKRDKDKVSDSAGHSRRISHANAGTTSQHQWELLWAHSDPLSPLGADNGMLAFVSLVWDAEGVASV